MDFTATSSPVVYFSLKSTLDYPLSLRFPVWTLSDLFVKHGYFKQWWCERYFMCFKSLIWSINIFPCQACWLCYSPNTGMLNIWLLYVLVIVSPFLCQSSMPKNSNWKHGVVVHLLLSQVFAPFLLLSLQNQSIENRLLCWRQLEYFRRYQWQKKPWTLQFSDLESLQNMGKAKLLFLHIFSLLHSLPATLPEKVKGHKVVRYQVAPEPEVGGKLPEEEAEIPEFLQKIKQTSWTHTIKSLKLIEMEIPRCSVEYSLVPHKRTKMGSSALFWKCTVHPSPYELRV